MKTAEREFPCECHDTDADHEAWLTIESAYWRAYFGLTGERQTDRAKLEAWKPFVVKKESA